MSYNKMGPNSTQSSFPVEALYESFRQGEKTGVLIAREILVEDIVKFFKLDYSLGVEIMTLIKSKDDDNLKMAMIMLISACKSSIKDEILEELNKELKK